MKILGISAYYHDSAAALIIDGRIIAAAQEERFTRLKNDSQFPEQAVAFCLKEAGLTIDDIDYLVYYEKPILKFERILLTCLRYFPKTFWFFVRSMITWFSDKLWIKGNIVKHTGIKEDKILFSQHHLSHACSSYFCSDYQEAAVLTIDGVGEWATTTIGKGDGNKLEILEEIRFPNSIGLLYSTITAYLGFEVNEGEYKVMGMASFGEPRYVDQIKQIFQINDDASFTNVEKFYAYLYNPSKSYTNKLVELMGPPRPKGDRFFVDEENRAQDQHYADVAKSLQVITEEAVLALARRAQKLTGSKNLCMAGGVALNCVANQRLIEELDFENVFIQPAAGDSGSALGAAFYGHHIAMGQPKIESGFSHPYWGTRVENDEIESEIARRGITEYKKYDDFKEVSKIVAKHLNEGKVVGWCQDRFEWGPRSLGCRSILADPRRTEMRDTVNLKIKFREPFRPFAPAALKERADEFFDLPKSGETLFKYMLATCKVKTPEQLGAITHFDGTGRVQTVDQSTNPYFYSVLKDFGELTGVPVLINTSFNLRGEPIVTTANNAMNTFYRSGLDVLVLNNYIIEKTEADKAKEDIFVLR